MKEQGLKIDNPKFLHNAEYETLIQNLKKFT